MPSPPPALDLNADLGEGIGDDAAMLTLVTSANVACGGHAGDANTMGDVCRRATDLGVRIGAHPAYMDRAGFGRTRQDVPEAELTGQLHTQVSELTDAATAVGASLTYLKPHGALYHAAARDHAHARAVATVAARFRLAVLGPPGALFLSLAEELGLAAYTEGFADRGYTSAGTLIPRGERGDLLTDPETIAGRVKQWAATGEMIANDGARLCLPVRSLCLHGDTPSAVAIGRRVREALAAAGLNPQAFT